MLTSKSAAGGLVACALVLAPISSASAQYYCHDIICGLGTAVVGTAAAIVTLPFAIVGAVTAPLFPPAYYGPPPAYYGPPPAYYRPPPAYYYAPSRPAYYAPPRPAYYGPPSRPAYYAPPATYYPAPGYYYGR